MPVDPSIYVAPSHGLAKKPVRPKKGLVGAAGGDLRKGSADPLYDRDPLSTSTALDCPTTGTVTPGAGQLSIAYTPASGTDKVEAVVRESVSDVFVKVVEDDGTSPVVITGLTASTEYKVWLRTKASDGRISRFDDPVTGTPT